MLPQLLHQLATAMAMAMLPQLLHQQATAMATLMVMLPLLLRQKPMLPLAMRMETLLRKHQKLTVERKLTLEVGDGLAAYSDEGCHNWWIMKSRRKMLLGAWKWSIMSGEPRQVPS